MRQIYTWVPAVIFTAGSLLTLGADRQQHLELEGDLATAVPARMFDLGSEDLTVSDAEVEVAGMDEYLLRSYGTGRAPTEDAAAGALAGFSVYVGFYGSQAQGRTIHSPKNCLPGSGWEALQSRETTVMTAAGAMPVNRYLLQRDDEQVLVLYWYQGRGRIRANEYLVKLDLLKDAALRGRSDEALVRVVVPIHRSEEEAFAEAERIAGQLIPAVDSVLPT